MTIHQATLKDLDTIAPLFDGYRVFYRQASDVVAAREFLQDRMQGKESIIYFALSETNQACGFLQLYPIFSSVSMERMYILNDLYIAAAFRGNGIGTALINAAKERCRKENQKGLVIQTEPTNPAQHLYTRLGFEKDPDLHYFWKTDSM